MQLSPWKIFVASLVCFILGVGAGFYLPFDWEIYLVTVALLLVVLILFWSEIPTRVVVLSLIFFILGVGRLNLALPKNNPLFIHFYNNQEVGLVGLISAEPDIRSNKINLIVSGEQLLIDNNQQNIKGKVLVQVPRYPEYSYGDRLKIKGKLQEPFQTEEFSYKNYLLTKGVTSVCYKPKIEVIGQSKGNLVYRYIYKFKNRFQATIFKILPEPQASFLAGLLYGARRGMPQEIIENFNRTGTSHIVAVSGFNITIIAVTVGFVLNYFLLSRKMTFILAALLIIFFTVLAGGTASVVRAAIMGLLALLAKLVGRKSFPTPILALTCFLMIVQNPVILRWDVSFQLSFLATVGILYFYPFSENWLMKLPKFIKEPLFLTLFAYLLTLPLILYQFGRISLVALPANILILEVIPLTMLLGFLAGGVGILFLPLGQMVGWFAWLLLSYMLAVTGYLANLPGAVLEVGKIDFIWIILFYFLTGGLFYFYKKSKTNVQKSKIS